MNNYRSETKNNYLIETFQERSKKVGGMKRLGEFAAFVSAVARS